MKYSIYSVSGCVGGNGKPFCISFKKGRVNKLLINFLGGGLSWGEESAKTPISIKSILKKKQGFYIPHVSPIFLKMTHVGILSAKDKRNLFRDWHILNIPYSTADFHIGDSDFHYKNDKGEDLVLHHHGMKNVTAALEMLKELFDQSPDFLMLSGSSAGGFGCLAHAPAIAALYPDCENIAIYAEGCNLRSSIWKETAENIWKVKGDLAAYVGSSDDLIFDLFRYAQDNMPPQTQFLHAVSIWDEALVRFMHKMNHGAISASPQALKEFNESLIDVVKKLKGEISNYSYFLTDFGKKSDGTTPHVLLGSPKLLYNKIQDDTPLASWLSQAFEKNLTNIGEKFIK
ncbi:MAG: pectinacetylesterase family protein [Defluviitaleaceae bacterium]|nr:pectinacetylesterase family protein [Defluviitaleaceae bacterium]